MELMHAISLGDGDIVDASEHAFVHVYIVGLWFHAFVWVYPQWLLKTTFSPVSFSIFWHKCNCSTTEVLVLNRFNCWLPEVGYNLNIIGDKAKSSTNVHKIFWFSLFLKTLSCCCNQAIKTFCCFTCERSATVKIHIMWSSKIDLVRYYISYIAWIKVGWFVWQEFFFFLLFTFLACCSLVWNNYLWHACFLQLTYLGPACQLAFE